jgi:hypothetical protein
MKGTTNFPPEPQVFPLFLDNLTGFLFALLSNSRQTYSRLSSTWKGNLDDQPLHTALRQVD